MPNNRRSLATLLRAALRISVLAAIIGITAYAGAAAARTAGSLQGPSTSGGASTRERARTAAALPLEGIFDGCNIATELSTCEQDLVQMHQAGMQVAVVGIQGAPLQSISSYASYAQSTGMAVMWEINDPGYWGGAWIGSSAAGDWTAFSTACGCTATTQILDYMIGWLAALPATYGYYAADDWTLTGGQVAGLTQYVSEIKSVDPNHMVMVGSTQAQGTTYYPTGATIGNEIYPETTANLMPYGQNLAAWQSVQRSVTQDARAAQANGKPSAFLLQSFTFGDNIWDGEAVGACTSQMTQSQCASRLNFPSSAVQTELRDQVLQYAHPSLILWFNFQETYGQGNRWAGLTRAVSAPYPVSASAARARRRARDARHRRY